MKSCLNFALRLNELGISVIPLGKEDKRPLFAALPNGKWQEYTTRRATADEIRGWFDVEPDANIGLVCGQISGIVAVDVDGEDGAKWFAENMPQPLAKQYTSSPHKFHALYAHPMGALRIPPSVKALHPEIDIRGDGSYIVFAPSIHPATKQPYRFAPQEGFKGLNALSMLPYLEILTQTNTKTRQNGVYGLENANVIVRTDTNLNGAENQNTGESGGKYDFNTPAEKGTRNSTLTSYCGRWFKMGMTRPEVAVLAFNFAARFQPPMPDREVQGIIDSVQRYHEDRLSFGDTAKKWIENAKGIFTLSQMYRELRANDEDKMEMCRVAANEMVLANQIEQDGNKYGTFRRKDNTLVRVDLDAEPDEELKLALPFNLQQYCSIQRGNIVLIAGETNAGKTALLFNICHQNRGKFNFRYITSEMSGVEIRSRILKLSGDPNDKWEDFVEFIDRSKDYADAILPDGINIVDYLEIYDDFSKMGAEIKKIFDRLTTGVCFVAIQKKRGEELGRGGDFSLEKARVAISLFTHGHLPDGVIGSCKITKCKNFRKSNPEGKEYFYRLQDGYKYGLAQISGNPKINAQLGYWEDAERAEAIQQIKSYCREQMDIDAQQREENGGEW